MKEVKVILRYRPQEYHSAPIYLIYVSVLLSFDICIFMYGRARKRERLTGSPGSGVMESLERRRGVDKVAAGEDINLRGNVLAIAITTTRIVTVFHWRHCWWYPGYRLGRWS